MARFLITSWPFPGHLYPQIAIATALRERGHECAFYTGAKAAAVLQAEGFLHFPFVELDEEKVYETLFSLDRPSSKPSGGLKFAHVLQAWILDTIPAQLQDLDPILRDWQPEVLVSDPCMWAGPLILSEQGRIPVAISSFVPACMVPGPDAPPFGLGLPSPKTLRTRLLSKLVSLGQSLLTRGFRKATNDLRMRYGLPAIQGTVLAYTGRVPLYLIPSAPEFDYNRKDLPPSIHYVGPCLWNKPTANRSPEWLQSLPSANPWVHVTEGTVHVGEPFLLKAAAQGLAGLPMEVIMTTGGDRDPDAMALGASAPNLHLARWISHTDLLPKTAVMITTGGAGSVLAALSAQVPLILVPTEWDKPEIAQRVVEAGAGIRIAPKDVSPETIRVAVKKILAEPLYKNNCKRLSNIFSRYGGPVQAAELLEGLLPRFN